MPELHLLLVFITAGLLLNLTPGPDVLYIVGRSLSQGRNAGVVSALGIGTGCLFHITIATTGLSALLLTFPLAFDVVRLVGAAYLVWLGIKTLLSKPALLQAKTAKPASLSAIYRQGVITNVLNPKVALFFIAFLPQFTDPTRGPVWQQILLLGVIFTINGTLVCLGYAVLAARVGDFLKSRYNVATWLNRLTSGLFIALGLRLAFLRR